MSIDKDKNAFIHADGDAQFKSRSHSIFDGLADLEKQHEREKPKNDPFAEDISTDNSRKQKRRMPKKVPDHVIHPEKWTKYSLKDDGSAHFPGGTKGDNLNKNIAIEFLNDLKRRKKEEQNSHDETETAKNLCFHTPSTLKRKIDEVDNETDQNSSNVENATPDLKHKNVIRMKPFEFGQKSEDTKLKKSNPKTAVGEELFLSHLEENYENEEDDNLEKQKSDMECLDEKIENEERQDQGTSRFRENKHSKKNTRQFHPEMFD